MEEIEAAAPGTKIVVYLKPDCRQFADEETVRGKKVKHLIKISMHSLI